MFLNVLAIRKIAVAKGCTVQRTVTLKQRPFVQIYDAKGRAIDGGKTGNGFSLAQAKRLLEAMPDSPARTSKKRGGPRTAPAL